MPGENTELAALYVEVGAHLNKLHKDFESAKQMTAKAGADIEKVSKNVDVGGFALKATMVIGAINSTIRGASAMVQAYNGEWMAAAETMKQLPFGLGGVARAIEDLLDLATGTTKEIKKWEEATKQAEVNLQRIQKERGASQQLWGAGGVEEQLASEKELLAAREGMDRDLVKADQERKKRLAEINAIIEQSGNRVPKRTEALIATAEENAQKKRQEIIDKYQAEADKRQADEYQKQITEATRAEKEKQRKIEAAEREAMNIRPAQFKQLEVGMFSRAAGGVGAPGPTRWGGGQGFGGFSSGRTELTGTALEILKGIETNTANNVPRAA